MTYREWPVAAARATVWTRVADGTDTTVLPDGCLDLIWDGSRLVVAGPDTGPHRAGAPPGTAFTALRFRPGTGPAVLDVPADAVRDQRVPLADLWPAAAVEDLLARLGSTDDPVGVLTAVAAARLARATVEPERDVVAGLLAAGRPVAEVADAVGCGERHLHRRSLRWYGYGPKTLARILRLQRALPVARSGATGAAVAAAAGYADQAHLVREARSLTGLTPRQLTG